MAMQLIETIEVGAGGATSIQFTNIPQDGADLLMLVSSRSTGVGVIGFSVIAPNSSGAGGLFLRGDGSNVTSGSAGSTLVESAGIVATVSTFSSNSVYIPNYTSAVGKQFLVETVVENNASLSRQQVLFAENATMGPITSITFTDVGDTLVQYSTASLYKIS